MENKESTSEKETQSTFFDKLKEIPFYSSLKRLFLENKIIRYSTIGLLLVVVAGVYYYFGIYSPSESEAKSLIWIPQKHFQRDSMDLSLYGKGPDNPGFLEIAEKYPNVPQGKLAALYAGLIYLKKERYDSALFYLKRASPSDKIEKGLLLGLIGQLYLELGEYNTAEEYLVKAASCGENIFIEPRFLFLLAQVKEHNGKYRESLDYYKKIQKDYPWSEEAKEIDKYIARVSAKLGIPIE